MRQTIPLLCFTAMVLVVAQTASVPAWAVPTPQQVKCEWKKHRKAGRYQACLQDAVVEKVKNPAFDLAAAKAACAASFKTAWLLQETNAADAGDECLDGVGNFDEVQAMLDAPADRLEACLSGGDLAACEALPPARLLKTGQTTAYGAGSDGDLEVGIAQGYVDNNDGTITDTSTGLMWEKKSDDGTIHDKDNTYTWCVDDDFNNVCDNGTNAMDGTLVTTLLAGLNAGAGFAGHTDWRLPNRKELESLTNLEIAFPDPSTFAAFNTGCGVKSSGNPGCSVTTCSCTVPSAYWSSSTYAYYPQSAWFVDFFVGNSNAYYKSYSYLVRAVRGGS